MSNTIQFLGAAGTVTGSKYLLNVKGNKYLVDCGIFQGKREWRERNWLKPDFNPEEIKAVLLTHAHVDHTGFLPRLYKFGLRCPVYCTKSTFDLCKILFPDMGRLQEAEAEYRKRKGKSRHKPPLPLYTEQEARETLDLFEPLEFNNKLNIDKVFDAEWFIMGHILGAAGINLRGDDISVTFSGDIGRYKVPILKDPQETEFGDLLLVESTYGNRLHNDAQPKQKLADIINETVERNGAVIIPSFAVGRAQTLLYYLRELKEENKIPDIPVIIDSPMAADATDIYRKNPTHFDENAQDVINQGDGPFKMSKLALIREAEASKKLNDIDEPMIIISASGMLSGGRILHHLYHKISSPRNTVIFVGFQPPGGRGSWIKGGAKSLKLFGEEVAIKAQIEEISGFSAHGDKDEMLQWLNSNSGQPKKVAIVHGEPDSAESFRQTISEEYNWEAYVPGFLETKEIV